MNIQIVAVSAAQVDELQEISGRTFFQTFAEVNTAANMQYFLQHFYARDKLTAELLNPASQFFFARMDEKTIGYLKLNSGDAQTVLPNPDGFEIERIYVDQSFKGFGVGSMFLNLTLERAYSTRAKYIWLGVWENNLPAIRFYEKNGFEIFGKHGFQLGDDLQTDLLMKKVL